MCTRGQQRYVTRGPIFVEKFAREPHYLKKKPLRAAFILKCSSYQYKNMIN